MKSHGLVKLIEESGEVIQVAAKMIAYPKLIFGSKLHPDGTNLRTRLVEEIGDCYAALEFVVTKLDLSKKLIRERAEMKHKLFKQWDGEP